MDFVRPRFVFLQQRPHPWARAPPKAQAPPEDPPGGRRPGGPVPDRALVNGRWGLSALLSPDLVESVLTPLR